MKLVYRLNKPQVACEELAGDIILLHFGSGFYYNLHGIAADICSYLLSGGTPETAVMQLATQFGLEVERVRSDGQSFFDMLVREGLFTMVEGTPTHAPMHITAKIYEPPHCQKFEDMADQLLLDKIDDQSSAPPTVPQL